MADGSISIDVSLNDKQAQAELNRLEKVIYRLQERLKRATSDREPIAEQARQIAEQYEREREILANMVKDPDKYTAVQIEEQTKRVLALKAEWEKAQKQVGKYDAAIEKVNKNIQWNSESAGKLAKRLAGAGDSNGLQDAYERIVKIGKRLASLFRKIFAFSLLSKTLKGFGDYLKTILNATPEFTAALGQLKSAFLTLAQPILSVVIPALSSLLQVITRVVTAIASLVSAIFGTTFEKSQSAAKALYEQADAYKAAGGSAKKASRQLAAFDELNILSEQNGGGGSTEGVVSLFDIDATKIPLAQKFMEWFEGLNLTPLTTAFSELKEAFGGLVDTIKRGFGWVWENILKPFGKWTIEEVAPRVVTLLARALEFLNTVVNKLWPILEPFWEKVLKPILSWAGREILGILDGLIGLLEDLIKLINGEISWKELWEGLDGTKKAILLFLGAVVAKKAIDTILSLAGAFGKFGTSVASNLTKAGASIDKGPKLVSMLKKVALGVFDALMIAYDTQKLIAASKTYREAQEAHNHETEVALESYRKLYEEKGKAVADEWAKMVYNVDTSGDDLIAAQERIAGQIETYWDDVPQNMWEGFKQGWNDYFVTGEKGGLIGLIGDAFQGVIDWVRQILGINSPSTVFRDIGDDMVQGLWDGFKATWDNFSSWLSGAWEGIKRWWNGLSLKAPTIQTTTNANGYSHYSGTFGIPGLASGAVIPPNREFLAVLGDQRKGTNIEAPLDTIVEAFKTALADSNIGGSFNLYLDGEPIYANVVRRGKQAARASGR